MTDLLTEVEASVERLLADGAPTYSAHDRMRILTRHFDAIEASEGSPSDRAHALRLAAHCLAWAIEIQNPEASRSGTPWSEIERRFAAAMERRYPGTRWLPVEGASEGDSPGAIRRGFVSSDDAQALRDRFPPTNAGTDDGEREEP